MRLKISRRMTVAVASVALVAGGGSAVALQTPGAPAGSAGIGDSYFPLDGNGGIDVLSYRIKQRWKPRVKRLSGTTTLRLTTLSDLRSFNLDFLLPVQSVTVGGAAARFSRPRAHELKIAPARPLTAGSTVTVRVKYAGNPTTARYRRENGFKLTRPGKGPGTLIAVNQPHMAAFWFPSNDHPSDPALVDVTTTVPRGLQVVGNGKLLSRRVAGSTSTWRWRAEEPMATYLAFFVAGPMDLTRTKDRSGRPTWYAVSKELSARERRSSMREIRKTPAITAWLERELGRPYPWSANGAVLMPELGFALENQTRPVYSAWPWLGTVVVHEIAHQWFGDQVRVNRWQDIWLNEGFASYMEWLYAESHGGMTVRGQLRMAYDVYGDVPAAWRVAPGAPGADKIFDQAVYDRGAMALAALRQRVGAATMRTIVTQWLTSKAGSSGSVGEFIVLAESVSGQDLTGFFNAWLYQKRAPARTAENGLA